MATFTQQTDNALHTIHVNDAFTFNDKKYFLELIDNLPNASSLIINLSNTSHLDSTALGLLIGTRDKLGSGASNITLAVGDNKEIQRLLEINKLYQLFQIQ